MTGPIARFGGISVGGIRFDSSGSHVSINQAPGSEEQLRAGQVVTVEGTFREGSNTGVADRITYESLLLGPVESFNPEINELVVLGQTVRITSDTSLASIDPGAAALPFAVGDIVEVSGFMESDDEISATRIDGARSAAAFQVHGTVANINEALGHLEIGPLTVSYRVAGPGELPRRDGAAGRPGGNQVRSQFRGVHG